jgi:hypothetical protein
MHQHFIPVYLLDIMTNNFTEVKTLLGHSNLAFSIECLLSFVNNAAEKIWLIIFEDGTLTPEDRIHLHESLSNSTIIDRNKCDKIVLDKLASYPACLKYRKSILYARKIFDLMLFDEKDTLYIDSDVFFVRKFSLPKFGAIPVFMYDSQNAYSFKPSEFLRLSYPIFPKVNSGFFFFPKEQFDLNYIEEILQNGVIKKSYIRGISWLEQTIWSFLASRYATLQYFCRLEVVMATEVLTIGDQTVCIHLVSTFRNHFEKVKTYARAIKPNEAAVSIQLVSAKRTLKAHHFYVERILKTLKRLLK